MVKRLFRTLVAGLVGVGIAFWAATGLAEPTVHDEAAQTPPAEYSPWAWFPVLAYSPETSGIIGGGAVYSFRLEAPRLEASTGRETRKSSLLMVTMVSLEQQFVTQLMPSIYVDGETWHLDLNIAAMRFPSTFFPYGEATKADQAEDYDQLAGVFEGNITRRVFGSLRVGGIYDIQYTHITEVPAGGVMDTRAVVGADGGYLMGVGPTIQWDDRDNNNSTSVGSRYEASAVVHHAALGSDFDYDEIILDARHFFPLAERHTLGVHVHSKLAFGDVPLQDAARLGGPNILRGFFQGRFTDKCMIEGQAEYRFPVAWRFGGVVFVGAGDVGSRPGELLELPGKAAGGGGLRFVLSEEDRVSIRADVAATNTGDVNYYVNLNEAF